VSERADRLPQPLQNAPQPWAAERASATPLGAPISSAPALLAQRAERTQLALHELQAFMIDAICEPDERATTDIVSDGPRLSARARVGIYRHAYRARLTECLQDDYPVLAVTLGEAPFEALCHEYIARHPSDSPSLNAFGRHMASVCASMPALESAAFCAELAALEWSLVEVIHAEAPIPLDLDALQRIPAEAWSGARLIGSQTLRLLQFRYPVNAYYQAYRAHGERLPLPAAEPSATAVYRHALTLWRMDLTPAMTRLLRALLAGENFATALNQIGVHEEDAAALAEAERSVMIWFREWVHAGFFAELITSSS
jgi:hypothetical protein